MGIRNQALEQFFFLFDQDGGYVRVPVWGHIPLSRMARRIIEHPDFVRLQRIRQLGLVHYVFPGATHTRFEHSVGTYHLSNQILHRLVLNPVNWRSPESPKISPEEARLFLAASLLHDIGHYPFAHLVDRLPRDRRSGSPGSSGGRRRAFQSHEELVHEYILGNTNDGSIYQILRDEWDIREPERVANIIVSPETAGLPGKMLSGILDPDKMDYLMRDGRACAVPYGNIDTERLIESFVLDVDDTRCRLGITEKGIAPLESLIFAKYMMFRHVYWHHAVRIAVAMFTRFVQDGLDAEVIEPSSFYHLADDALLEKLCGIASRLPSGQLMTGLRDRVLYKRGITLYPGSGGPDSCITGDEIERMQELYWDPRIRKEKELAICAFLNRVEGTGLTGFEVLIDLPRADSVFDIDDLKELRVLVESPTGELYFVPFEDSGLSQLTADFAQQFERRGRRVQIVCRPDLRGIVVKHRKAIKEIVVSG